MPDPTSRLRVSLRASGRRVTGQRRLLLALIQEHDGHIDAHELYRRARVLNPRLSLSTVYRTVRLLREIGLVDELHLGEEHHHYEIRSSALHHHLICARCGRVTEFRGPFTEALVASVARENDFEVADVRVELTGLCASCRVAPSPKS